MEKKVRQIVEQSIDWMFQELSSEYNLSTGDISPMDDILLEDITESLTMIAKRFIDGNEKVQS